MHSDQRHGSPASLTQRHFAMRTALDETGASQLTSRELGEDIRLSHRNRQDQHLLLDLLR